MAGGVKEIGPGVTSFRPGDEVYGTVGGLPGTLAQSIAADVDLLAHKPGTLSMRETAALPLVTITAWEGLVGNARVGEGHRVLVHAGAGSGLRRVADRRAFGAKVFATVSAGKRQIVEELGARLSIGNGLPRSGCRRRRTAWDSTSILVTL